MTDLQGSMCAYLQCVTGVILCGLVFEGLAQQECALVVHLIPVFAVTHIQDRPSVGGALLMPQLDLRMTHSTKKKTKMADLSVTIMRVDISLCSLPYGSGSDLISQPAALLPI